MARKQQANTASQAITFVTSSPEETQRLGEQIGGLLKPGDVLALDGELGSGKTTLTQGIAKGLGCDPDRVKSPTFVLVREYLGPVSLIHIDAYRLSGAPDAAWLDIELLFTPKSVTLIEWAQRLGDSLPPEALLIQLHHVSTNRRKIIVSTGGGFPKERLMTLQQAAESQKPEENVGETVGD